MNDFFDILFAPEAYYRVLWGMAGLAVVVWLALTRIEAPYGMTYRPGWGPALDNRVGWVLMEAPAFLCMAAIMVYAAVNTGISDAPWSVPTGVAEVPTGADARTVRPYGVAAYVCGALYLIHYFRRSFVFPLKMRGRSRMPLVIALMGAVFNIVNVYLIGGWLFVLYPMDYPLSWLWSWQFIVGTCVFFLGMAVNMRADHIVRHLRRPGDTRHYIPRGGMFRYVSAASYLGELVEWAGFALLTWSWAGAVFLLWTAANLVPRAGRLHARYLREFGAEYSSLHRKRIIPYIY